jgi:hypothetical protein
MDEPKRISSRAEKTIKLVVGCLFVGFVVAVVIPEFIAASLSNASNACVNNLRQIESAKKQWVLENSKGTNDAPTTVEIAAYLKNNQLPACPKGGTYTVGRVNEDPTCSISTSSWPNDHVLNVTNSWWINFKSAYRAVFTQHPSSASQ